MLWRGRFSFVHLLSRKAERFHIAEALVWGAGSEDPAHLIEWPHYVPAGPDYLMWEHFSH